MTHPPSSSRPRSLLLAACLAGALAGCAHKVALDSAQSSTDNFQKAKAAGIRPVAVGDFTAPGSNQTEAQYLKDTLVVELQGAGLIDPASGSVVQASQVDAKLGRNQGNVVARFTVTQADGRVVYDRELRASSTWPAGADVAKERAAVYRKLVGVLLTDPGFRNAVPR
jgi:hypothetical protein